MKSLYQTTLEQFTGTQELKEGDYVVCPMYPNDAVKLLKSDVDTYYFAYMARRRTIYFNKEGKSFTSDDFPLFLKCSPPKKKVEKVFEVYISKGFLEFPNERRSISTNRNEIHEGIKAKLIVEVEE
jgi:hypothetical protein